MKKAFVVLMTLAMVVGFASVSLAGISGSSHDLSDDYSGTGICKFCHVPHNPTSTAGPLWNHAVTGQTFTLYSGSTGSASGVSAICLGCHDGVTNLDAFGGSTGTAGNDIDTKFSGTDSNIGTDLRDDHPVMVTYTSGNGFKDVASLTTVKLFSSKVECASCHDPHDQATNGYFLRSANNTSQMCLTCHDK